MMASGSKCWFSASFIWPQTVLLWTGGHRLKTFVVEKKKHWCAKTVRQNPSAILPVCPHHIWCPQKFCLLRLWTGTRAVESISRCSSLFGSYLCLQIKPNSDSNCILSWKFSSLKKKQTNKQTCKYIFFPKIYYRKRVEGKSYAFSPPDTACVCFVFHTRRRPTLLYYVLMFVFCFSIPLPFLFPCYKGWHFKPFPC